MVDTKYQSFEITFWNHYDTKNYAQIIKSIPELLKFECVPENASSYYKVCIFSIIAMTTTTVNYQYVKEICSKYHSAIANASSKIDALQCFNCLEYVTELTDASKAVDRIIVQKTTDAVFSKVKSCKKRWSEDDLKMFNRYIIVVVELESLLSNEILPKFPAATKAIKYFASVVTDDRKNGWPDYLLSTLQVLESGSDKSLAQLQEKVRRLTEGHIAFRKDIAIMMSQVICAGRSLIPKRSPKFMVEICRVADSLYGIIRDKCQSSSAYTFQKTFSNACCDKTTTHAGLQILETVRTIFVEAFNGDNYNEELVSVMSNHVVAETEALHYTECKDGSRVLRRLSEMVVAVVTQADKIATKCGLDRAKRTLQRLLSTKPFKVFVYCQIVNELIKLCEHADNKTEQIEWYAIKLVLSEPNRANCMYKIHSIQKELNDANKFETISAIVARLPKDKNPLKLDPAQLQFLQLTVEFDYPILPEFCLKKLADDMCAMDYYKNARCCYVNLHKSGICYLRSMMHVQRYKSRRVEVKNVYQPLNGDSASLKNEIEIVKELKEALQYLSTFVRDHDGWMTREDNKGHISLAEKMLQRIGDMLMNRHYKDLAVAAFDSFYQLAKLTKNPLQQIVAAGHLVENIHLVSTTSEAEIVTELQSSVMRKLRDVNTMSVDELGSFLISFLQLTMYTMRHQFNMEHAKKYMQAINKLLNKYDSNKEKYLAAQLKYAEVMFELIVKDADASITPMIFIEDIFHRFQTIRYKTHSDHSTVPGIIFDLISTVYAFTQPRFELRYHQSLVWTVHSASLRNGYLFLFAKTTILTSCECLLISGKHLEDHMKHLDVLFGSKTAPAKQEDRQQVETITWDKEITSLIHPDNCECFQCANKFLNHLNMEAAAVKAWAIYYSKDFRKSMESFQQIYDHWKASNTPSYSGMLMNYSNCLISNRREEKSKCILNEALDACNDYAQAQDISVRLLCNAVKNEVIIDDNKPFYINDLRPKPDKPAAKKSSKPSGSSYKVKEPHTYRKKGNLRH